MIYLLTTILTTLLSILISIWLGGKLNLTSAHTVMFTEKILDRALFKTTSLTCGLESGLLQLMSAHTGSVASTTATQHTSLSAKRSTALRVTCQSPTMLTSTGLQLPWALTVSKTVRLSSMASATLTLITSQMPMFRDSESALASSSMTLSKVSSCGTSAMSWNQSGLTLKHTIRAGSTKRNLLVSSSFND
jgi:hypothetical protein